MSGVGAVCILVLGTPVSGVGAVRILVLGTPVSGVGPILVLETALRWSCAGVGTDAEYPGVG